MKNAFGRECQSKVPYRGIGEEIATQLDGEIHGVCMYVGGAFVGTTQALTKVWPDLIRTIVEPAESAVIAGNPPGTHHIEGGGAGFVPPLITPALYDRYATQITEGLAKAHQAGIVHRDLKPENIKLAGFPC